MPFPFLSDGSIFHFLEERIIMAPHRYVLLRLIEMSTLELEDA